MGIIFTINNPKLPPIKLIKTAIKFQDENIPIILSQIIKNKYDFQISHSQMDIIVSDLYCREVLEQIDILLIHNLIKLIKDKYLINPTNYNIQVIHDFWYNNPYHKQTITNFKDGYTRINNTILNKEIGFELDVTDMKIANLLYFISNYNLFKMELRKQLSNPALSCKPTTKNIFVDLFEDMDNRINQNLQTNQIEDKLIITKKEPTVITTLKYYERELTFTNIEIVNDQRIKFYMWIKIIKGKINTATTGEYSWI